MLDWLQQSLNDGETATLELLALRLILSFVLGCVVAGIYVFTQGKSFSEYTPFVTTIVLLTILIAMVTLVIGNSVARAFSLVGALAIVRFRTVVEDTRDTAFVIFAVVVGMGVGAGYILVPLVGIPVVALASSLLTITGRLHRSRASEFSLTIRLTIGRNPEEVFRELFAKHLSFARLNSTTTARQGSALDYGYLVRLSKEENAVTFVGELNKIEGVQNIELHRL